MIYYFLGACVVSMYSTCDSTPISISMTTNSRSLRRRASALEVSNEILSVALFLKAGENHLRSL